jgi:hypothetical protein
MLPWPLRLHARPPSRPLLAPIINESQNVYERTEIVAIYLFLLITYNIFILFLITQKEISNIPANYSASTSISHPYSVL